MAEEKRRGDDEIADDSEGSWTARSVDDESPADDGYAVQAPDFEAAPFSLADVAQGDGFQRNEQKTSGQFSGDDLEFESFMFDTGDGGGLPPRAAVEAPATPSAELDQPAPAEESTEMVSPGPEFMDAVAYADQTAIEVMEPEPLRSDAETEPASVPFVDISGQDVPVPSYAGAFVEDSGVPSSPPAGEAEAAPLYAAPGGMDAQAASPPTPVVPLSPSQFPASASEWSDQLLASVEDFSSVLLALRGGQQGIASLGSVAAATVPVVPVSGAESATSEAPFFTGGEVAPPASLTGDGEGGTAAVEASELSGETPSETAGLSWLQTLGTSQSEAAESASEPAMDLATEPAVDLQPEPAFASGYPEPAPEPDAQLDSEPGALQTEPAAEPEAEPVAALEVEPAELEPEPVADLEAEPIEAVEVEPVAAVEYEAVPEHIAEPVEETTFTDEPQIATPASSLEEAPLMADAVEVGALEGSLPEESMAPIEPVDEPDANLPPWLQEDASTPEGYPAAAAAVAAYEVPEYSAASPDYEAFDGAQGAYVEAPVPAVEVQPAGANWLGGADVHGEAAPGSSPEMSAGVAGETTSEDYPDLSKGGLSGDDLEFENFMFDAGAAAPLPALPNMAGFMPAVRDMEGAVAPEGYPAPATSESGQQAYQQTESGDLAGVEPVRMESVEEAGEGPLPFWLQDTAVAETPVGGALSFAEPSESYMAGVGDAEPFQPSEGSDAAVEETSEAEVEDFAELPPIEPFDFSMVQTPVQEEALGFKTDELAGSTPSTFDPLMVTANLDVLADLMRKDRISGVLDINMVTDRPQHLEASRPAPASEYSSPATPATETAPQVQEPAAPEAEMAPAPASGYPEPAVPASADAESPYAEPSEYTEAASTSAQAEQVPTAASGWTSTETSQLGMDTVSELGGLIPPDEPVQAPTEVPPAAPVAARAKGTDVLPIGDLDVVPFDISELGLETDESNTEYLNTVNLHRSTQNEDEGFLTGTLFKQPEPQRPGYWEGTDWGDTGSAQRADGRGVAGETDDMDTSRFTAAQQQQIEEEDAELPTRRLGGRQQAEPEPEDDEAGPVDENNPESIFKVRVSRFKIGDAAAYEDVEGAKAPAAPRVQPDRTVAHNGAAPSVAPAAPSAPASLRPEGVNSEQVTQAPPDNMPASMRPGPMTSGPLSPLTGFHELEQMVAERPEDLGTRMALAVAYAQAGHLDHSMYEYRRLLKHRNIPGPLLDMIADQLADFEAEAGHLARYHKVRGDLYMKQGLYQEAIAEYNKIS
jgi:hypothetical protein